MRGAALPLLLIVAACGRGPSRAELQDRVTELEDENDTLKQQLGEAQDQLAEKRAKAQRRTPAARPVKGNVAIVPLPAVQPPARVAQLDRKEPRSAEPAAKPRKVTREAENAATQALVAAADARKALAQR
ncbi:hypothetical protein KRR38_05435 [Novosphingobium sp. G106]|uniref:hypothetical protein n=1 Tax=Novosphingobium sp. G106 TaxID=2849500 RepID=UPI001C2DECFB|nr:hypothetical protein [Novosphingobium sp. G106]MBV1687129.1 hypothetical protein [Novosphingobium sp. G106]